MVTNPGPKRKDEFINYGGGLKNMYGAVGGGWHSLLARDHEASDAVALAEDIFFEGGVPRPLARDHKISTPLSQGS